MTTATFQTRDVLEAAKKASERYARDERFQGNAQPGSDYHRIMLIFGLALASVNYGEPSMQVSPEDFTLIADAFYDHKDGRGG